MRVRLTEAVSGRKVLSLSSMRGSLPPTYDPGDYTVGDDIPEDIARDAIFDGKAIRIPEAGERETKLA